ncbi:MAG: hypothetical protein A3J29_00290 [Acidobacteria bacterium RIFCSPLOWO2_12_FULL_67_14b]|nr:MAG: hypothetical protein A3J29_00290 [Acidobacteria bacterium RIFCSPLOWO2_12_FULL_67_14b]
MSKKKKKAAPAKKATTKKAKKPARKAGARMASAGVVAAPRKRTAAATIFVYQIDGQSRVRTSPQLLGAGPGQIEWTVVNLTSDAPVDVEISWPNESPWGGKDPLVFRGNLRKSLEGARDGHYKYNVTANGYTEDPELEIPEM